MATFENITAQEALKLLGTAKAPDYKANAAFYDGDHWQSGTGWTGPSGDPKQGTDYSRVMALIADAFVSKNAIREVVDRHQAGVIGREPMWRLTPRRRLENGKEPTDEEMARIQEAEAFLTDWWDERGAVEKLQATTVKALLGERGVLRLFVPSGKLLDGRVPRGEGLEAAKDFIFVSEHGPDEAAVHLDQRTMNDLGIYSYKDETEGDFVELSYLNDTGQTIVRVMGNAGDETGDPLELGGHLTFHEIRLQQLITDPVRRNQKLLNKARTMLSRNVDLGGFVERTILNGLLPGSYQDDGSGGQKWVPDEQPIGAGVTTTIQGIPQPDGDGKEKLTNPSIIYKDPVPVATFEETEASSYKAILQDTAQLHVLLAEEAGASGRSRVEARSDYQQSLLKSKPKVERAGRWLLETVLAMAAHFTGQAGRFADLRVEFNCILDTGPRSAEEELSARENYSAGLLSRETAMSRIGVEDTESEKARIEAEKAMEESQEPAVPGQEQNQQTQEESPDDRADQAVGQTA